MRVWQQWMGYGAGMTLALFCVGCGHMTYHSSGPKLYVLTDLEGASGVYKFVQTRDKGSAENLQACAYLMGDLAAVVRGFRDAGASEIVLLDGHGNQAFVPHLAEPGARYLTGTPRSHPLYGLDETFDGIAMIGLHAMMGTQDGVLHHTQSSRDENRYWYNNVESGEIAQVALIAGHYGVPTIMVSGDEATCREANKFLSDEIVTVATKRGINRESAVLYPFAETRQALYEGARRAVAAIPRCKPYRIEMPIRAKKQWLARDPAGIAPPRLQTKEGVIENLLELLKF